MAFGAGLRDLTPSLSHIRRAGCRANARCLRMLLFIRCSKWCHKKLQRGFRPVCEFPGGLQSSPSSFCHAGQICQISLEVNCQVLKIIGGRTLSEVDHRHNGFVDAEKPKCSLIVSL